MIKNLKLIKYGYQFKSNMVFSILFMLLGIVVITFSRFYNNPATYALLYCSFLFTMQVSSTLMASDMVKSSPRYRKFCMRVPKVINFAAFLITVILLLLIRFIQKDSIDEFMGSIGNELAITGFMYFVCMLYMSFVYKFALVSMIFFLVSFAFSSLLSKFIMETYNFTFAWGVGIIILFLVIGMALSEIIMRATYKMPPSRLAQSASFRKYI